MATFVRKRNCKKKIVSSDDEDEDESSESENESDSESSNETSSCDERAVIQPSKKGKSICQVTTRSSSSLKDEKKNSKNKVTAESAESSQGLRKKRNQKKIKKIFSSDEDASSGNENGFGIEGTDEASSSDDITITQTMRKSKSICHAKTRSYSRLQEKDSKEATKKKVMEDNAESSQDLTKRRGRKRCKVVIAEDDSDLSMSDIELQDVEITPKKENEDDSEMKTPENHEETTVHKGRRSSIRVKQKLNSRGSFKMPDRKKILDSIEDYSPEKELVLKRRLSPKRLANNFLKEYVLYSSL